MPIAGAEKTADNCPADGKAEPFAAMGGIARHITQFSPKGVVGIGIVHRHGRGHDEIAGEVDSKEQPVGEGAVQPLSEFGSIPPAEPSESHDAQKASLVAGLVRPHNILRR